MLNNNVLRPSEQVEVRNVWLEQVLDPDNNLPSVGVVLLDGAMNKCEVTLPPDIPFVGNAGSLYINKLGTDETIGDAVFGKDDSVPMKLVVTDTSVIQGERGKGYGKRLYLEALKSLPAGFGLISHSMLSADAELIWQWLVDAGVAQERKERPNGQLGKYETTY